jgi:hypothetical protein
VLCFHCQGISGLERFATTNLTFDTGLISKIYKELKKLITKKCGIELKQDFTTEESRMAKIMIFFFLRLKQFPLQSNKIVVISGSDPKIILIKCAYDVFIGTVSTRFSLFF